MDYKSFFRGCKGAVAVLFAGSFLLGCQASGPSGGFKFDPLASGSGAVGSGAAVPMPSPQPSSPQVASGRILNVGDGLTVSFQDVIQSIPPIVTTVKEDGKITLIYNIQFQAAGKTVSELENDIRSAYVPKYFVNMTPTITLSDRFYYVDGEVKGPGRQVYLNRMHVAEAIATAGGFTDFARKGKVQLTRANGQKFYVNYPRALTHPELNLEVFPDDKVYVYKRWW